MPLDSSHTDPRPPQGSLPFDVPTADARHGDEDARLPVVLSLGMGCDSAAILTRWMKEPDTRWVKTSDGAVQPFDLEQLVVVTAMVGSEFDDTIDLMNRHLLPAMREHKVRFVQLARGGPLEADGVVVLSDTREPLELFADGVYRLEDELLAAGTIPQVQSGRRQCSIKYKGSVIDRWLADTFGARPFHHVMGFNFDEQFRVERDRSYSTTTRQSTYPLVDWRWGRADLESYLLATWGEPWRKSACYMCCFSACNGGVDELLRRWRQYSDAAGRALFVEHLSLALNPNAPLFGKKRARDLVVADGNVAALAALQARLDAGEWALYEVRRIMFGKGVGWRSVKRLEVGSAQQMGRALNRAAARLGAQVVDEAGSRRAWLTRRGAGFPTWERMLVAAPAVVVEKQRPGFEAKWSELVDTPQLELLAG